VITVDKAKDTESDNYNMRILTKTENLDAYQPRCESSKGAQSASTEQ
jgi:hypothetical protein